MIIDADQPIVYLPLLQRVPINGPACSYDQAPPHTYNHSKPARPVFRHNFPGSSHGSYINAPARYASCARPTRRRGEAIPLTQQIFGVSNIINGVLPILLLLFPS